MKLTKETLDKLIQEEMQKSKNQKFKNDYERQKHLKKQQDESEERRRKKKELRPDLDLIKLSKGILQEEDLLIAEPTDGGYVKIKKDALRRILSEGDDKVQELCNRHRYFQLDQILDFISKLKQADKGKI